MIQLNYTLANTDGYHSYNKVGVRGTGAETKCKLFAYGSLRPGFNPPKTMCNIVEDYVEGHLTDEGDYPVLHLEPGCGNWVPGVTMTISSLELPALDKYEGDEYERIKTLTYNEHIVYVYVGRNNPYMLRRAGGYRAS